MKSKFGTFVLIVILTVIQGVNIYSFFIKNEYEYMFETIGVYILYLVFFYIDEKKHLHIKYYLKVLAVLTLVLHSLLGHNLKLYITTTWFDDILHFFGIFSFSLLSFFLIKTAIPFYSDSKIFIFILVFSLGVTLGACFEIVEFLSDVSFNTYHQKGLIDTNLDLIFDVTGAIFASFFVVLKENNV